MNLMFIQMGIPNIWKRGGRCVDFWKAFCAVIWHNIRGAAISSHLLVHAIRSSVWYCPWNFPPRDWVPLPGAVLDCTEPSKQLCLSEAQFHEGLQLRFNGKSQLASTWNDRFCGSETPTIRDEWEGLNVSAQSGRRRFDTSHTLYLCVDGSSFWLGMDMKTISWMMSFHKVDGFDMKVSTFF